MAKWKSGYRAYSGIGIFDDVIFLPATVQEQWNLLTTQYSGINRVLALDAQYGQGYVGGVPASGQELTWAQVTAISTNQSTPTTLFGVKMGTGAIDPIVVVKAYRGNSYEWGIDVLTRVTAINVTCQIYKRVYSDETTYTETLITTGGCRAVQPDSGSASNSHTWIEFFKYQNTYCFGMSNYFVTGNYIRSLWNLSFPEQTSFENEFGDEQPETTPPKSDEFGEAAEPQGGYNEEMPHGTFDFSSDEIPISPKPSLGVTSAGFINVYKIGLNELQDLGEKLFPHFLPAEILGNPSQMNVQEMLAIFIKMAYGSVISPAGASIEFADNLGIFDIIMNGKLIDYVLDCHVIPTSISGATVSPLRIGYRTFNDFQLAKATEDYVDIDCGSLNIKECFGNFLDYNCKVEIFLPFVGFVPIANEYWNNATLQVHYRFNIVDGSFQARLVSSRDHDGKECVLNNAVIGQYGGVCCVHFPITGLQYSNVISGLVNGTASAVSKGASGDYAGVATSLSHMANLKPDAPMSNGYNASSSFLGQRIPYLVIKYPAPQFSQNYANEIGLPLNVYYPLSSVSGFTVVDNPILNINCSDEEYNEIVSNLKSGVIL